MYNLLNNGGLNNSWNSILENIMRGDGNHEWYIEFIPSGKAMSDKFNKSFLITNYALMEFHINGNHTSAVYQYEIPLKHSW